MQSAVWDILLHNHLCVLCTCSRDIPDASLMLYLCDDGCAKLRMLTLQDTTKYQNITRNPHVSILFDTRDRQGPAGQTQALTVHGEATIVEDKDRSRQLLSRLIQKHASLSNLASNDSVRVIEVSIRKIILLENVDKVSQVDLPQP